MHHQPQIDQYLERKAQQDIIVGLREKAKVERLDKPVEAPAKPGETKPAEPKPAKVIEPKMGGLKEKLLREREKEADSHFVKFITAALLRSDTKTTYETLSLGIRAMIITPNEARGLLDMDALDDPAADRLINPAITTAEPGEDAEDEDEDGEDEDPPAPPDNRRLRAVIVARTRDLAGVELERLRKIAGSPDAPAKREAFFDNWQPRLVDAVRPLAAEGVEVDQAIAAWLRESRAAGELDEATWQARAERLADQLI
jgi:hypothetical protein